MRAKSNFLRLTKKFVRSDSTGALIILAVMFLLMTFTTESFFTKNNLFNLLRYSSFYVMLSLGVLVVLMAGAMDMSTGSTMGLAGIIAAMMAKESTPVVWILLVGVAIGIAIGTFNGFLVGYLGFQPFIASMGTKIMIRGVILVSSGGYPINGLNENFNWLGVSYIFGIPTPIIITAGICLVTWYMLNKTTLGRNMAATGGNRQAALVCGINIKRTKQIAYMYCGALAAISGMIMTARISSGQLSTGDGFEMDAIAGAVIGGASMAGGMGTVFGAICGTLVMSTLKNGMDLLHMNAYWQQIAQGAIIIIAVSMDIMRRNMKRY